MNIDTLPRIKLTQLPTPLEKLDRLSQELGGPSIFIKRDDLTSLAMGGNKTRKLEYLLGDALAKGADTVITAGGIQSNHCRLTAAAAVKVGLDCELVLAGNEPDLPDGNLLLDNLFKAKITWCAKQERNQTMEQVALDLRARGKTPYVIPVGGSNEVGTVGYVQAMLELTDQLEEQNINAGHIVVASSSGGTHAGLALGSRICGFKGRVLGMSIDQVKTGKEAFPPVLAEIAGKTAQRLGVDETFSENDFNLNCDYLGAGYAVPGELEREAILLASTLESILLGPVYTGRAMGGLIDLIRKGAFTPEDTVVFWHTGGTPELFAYKDEFVIRD